MTSVPKNLNYNNLKPLGFPATIKPTIFNPLNGFSSLSKNSVVSFQINSKGFWDPYSTFINLVVNFKEETTDTKKNTRLQQIDGSANCFINEFIATCQGTELERIQEYDVLNSILTDMAYSPGTKSGRSGLEGMGYNITPNIKTNTSFKASTNTVKSQGGISYFDTATNYQEFCEDAEKFQNTKIKAPKKFPYPTQIEQPLIDWNGTAMADTIDVAYNPLHIFSNSLLQNATFAEIVSCESKLATNQGYLMWKAYSERMDESLLRKNNTYGGAKLNSLDPNFDAFDCPQISNNSWEPAFSSEYKQKFMKFGKLTNEVVSIANFTVPLLSGLFGVLMPQDDYRYIPIFAFKDLLMDFRLNPYACFTTGYNDTLSDVPSGSKSMTDFTEQSRYWQIMKFEINVDIIVFDYSIEQIIQNQLVNGIIFHTHSWILGPEYLLDKTINATSTWHINLSFESLKALFWVFISNEYKKHSFCRKNYRLSGNISRAQIRIGIDYFPSMPIEGVSGSNMCTQLQNQYYTNIPFINHLWKAMNKFNDINHECSINTTNFAINKRPYNVNNTNPLITLTELILPTLSIDEEEEEKNIIYDKKNKLGVDWNPKKQFKYTNLDTANGMPMFYENMYVGKAVYGISLESMSNDGSVVSGINTKNFTPFELNLVSSGDPNESVEDTDTTDNSRTMLIFCHYDMLLQIKGNSFNVLGR